MTRRTWIAPAILIGSIVAVGVTLAVWKQDSFAAAAAESAHQPEPMEAVAVAVAQPSEHSRSTTSIGTVVALRSISLRNELPGTVRRVNLAPGRVVEAGTVLVALDVSVEQAELKALEAQAALAETQLARTQRMSRERAASAQELDTAQAERDVALAQVERTRAIIARKIIRAPFRARIGISDVHPGQYLNEGTTLTTLQGVDDAAYVDFTVAQQVAASLQKDGRVEIFTGSDDTPTVASIVAIDARVDPGTRNATVRAKIADNADQSPAPGASVRVQVPVGVPVKVVTIPASALRKGPAGDHVFVVTEDDKGQTRAHVRTVQVEPTAGDSVVVLKGLSAGERVAASGSFKLREAVLVGVAAGSSRVAEGNSEVADGGSSAAGSF